jgi:hypothetical protein
MNLLDALIVVRNAALINLRDRTDQSALKVVNRKIQSLERKKAWRECASGTMPPHATDPNHPLNQ